MIKEKIREIKMPFFYASIWNGAGWFRIFGRGLHWKDTTRHRLYFSERNGYDNAVTIGKWRISYLKKK